MQQTNNAVLAVRKLFRQKLAIKPAVIFISSVVLTLIAIFGLSSWAEASGLHHAIQHVLIFTSGLGAGASLVSTNKKRKDS